MTMSYIDTCDLVSELNDLEAEDGDGKDGLEAEEIERRDAIRELLEDIGSEDDDGVTLIPEDGFVEYAQELAEDIGAVEDFSAWPATCIDWQAAANDLATDYSTVEFDGESYYYQGG